MRYTAHYTVPDWQCLHSGLGHGVRAHQDVLKAAHSGILCILPIRYSSKGQCIIIEHKTSLLQQNYELGE